ncbi:MAG TPA: hypothetical protein ENI67_06605 [Gammaproteobacteria bacterium]|nr:hypothetical protein [Gammaproteobacteria bacterium]
MTIKTQTTLASAAGLLWKVIEFYDLDPEPFFRKARINPQLMNDPQARFSLRSIDTIYKELYETINDPCMGLKLASLWHPSHLSRIALFPKLSIPVNEACRENCMKKALPLKPY